MRKVKELGREIEREREQRASRRYRRGRIACSRGSRSSSRLDVGRIGRCQERREQEKKAAKVRGLGGKRNKRRGGRFLLSVKNLRLCHYIRLSINQQGATILLHNYGNARPKFILVSFQPFCHCFYVFLSPSLPLAIFVSLSLFLFLFLFGFFNLLSRFAYISLALSFNRFNFLLTCFVVVVLYTPDQG